MVKQFILALTLFLSVVYSRTVLFKVISFGNKTQLQIVGGKKYNIKPYNSDPLLCAGKLTNAPNKEFQYYYIVDGVKEDFYRTYTIKTNTTYHEFFGRKVTLKTLKTFKHPSTLPNWNRSVGKTNLFDDAYIPTIHFTGNTTEYFFHNPTRDKVQIENVTFYLKNTKKTFSNIIATAKNRDFSKFQIRMELNDGGINGRTILKLRNGGEDPLNLRQFIYGHIIESIGMPSIKSVMVRVYVNKKPAGFYTLQEEAFSESFIKNEFYGNPSTGDINLPKKLGYPIDCEFGSDFEYKPNNATYYQYFYGSHSRLLPLCKAISELNPKNESALQTFESQWFDIDTFHKAMAMEYLTGDWDGYWHTTSNYAIYDDPNQSTKDTFKFYFITQDHDETWGVGLIAPINSVGDDFPSQSYTTMLNRQWHIVGRDTDYRTLVDKFIAGSPALQKRFQNTLIAIVQTIFNPVAFRSVVESYRERYEPEMEWDFSFERPYNAGKRSGIPIYYFNHFQENFEKGVGGLHWGIYQWVEQRAEAIKNEFCITWDGDQNPPSKSCTPTKYF
ncbi:hypothetical protein BCR36DRAFT_587682 [Piromyces finnis]|uniref:Coth-domain-containing protein n=1 Tax=Piromyces finnis TaxID=1754191 RepID=A0A1Y1UXD3_9FUNG|nr:hypothetical protein BCR36DRAFT_587682 [Piromyces finnis]|eukprot:ORX41884.1 hypothetical protein BCR36DRAFT_587682 [Piromyces finnis]